MNLRGLSEGKWNMVVEGDFWFIWLLVLVCWESVDALEKKKKKKNWGEWSVETGEVWWKEQPWRRQHVGSKKKKKKRKGPFTCLRATTTTQAWFTVTWGRSGPFIFIWQKYIFFVPILFWGCFQFDLYVLILFKWVPVFLSRYQFYLWN